MGDMAGCIRRAPNENTGRPSAAILHLAATVATPLAWHSRPSRAVSRTPKEVDVADLAGPDLLRGGDVESPAAIRGVAHPLIRAGVRPATRTPPPAPRRRRAPPTRPRPGPPAPGGAGSPGPNPARGRP